jgi:cell division protein FtsL
MTIEPACNATRLSIATIEKLLCGDVVVVVVVVSVSVFPRISQMLDLAAPVIQCCM